MIVWGWVMGLLLDVVRQLISHTEIIIIAITASSYVFVFVSCYRSNIFIEYCSNVLTG